MLPVSQGTISQIFFIICVVLLIDESNSEGRVVCYYTNWSVYRPGTAKFNPQNINPYLCTHLIYAFGGFTKDNTLKPFDKYQDIEQGGYAKFTGLKTFNKKLKTLLAIGGWNEASSRFSPLVANPERRQQFIKNILKFLRQNHFDGLDLDWEYPAHRDGGKSRDKDNYAQFVQDLRAEFDRESSKTGRPRLLLTMAVPAGIEYIEKGYDIPKLNKYLDWFNILSYDYHSAYEPSVNHHAPLYSLEDDSEYNYDGELNIDYTVKYYLSAGADRDKLVLGIPTYGRSYTLINEESTDIGSPSDGPGEQGDATREKGYMAYYEICQNIRDDPTWQVMQPNPKAMGPYAYKNNQWVGYDDEAIVRKKGEYVANNGLGGIMFWSIDNDDFRGLCTGKPYPLIEAAKEALLDNLRTDINEVSKPSNSKKLVRTRTRTNSTNRNKITSTESLVKDVGEFSRKDPTRRPSINRKHTTIQTPTTTLHNARRTTTPEPPTTPDPGSDFKCEEEGFFQHPRDCKKYFWCLDSGPSNLGIVAHQFTCPSGLYFNPAADSCDFSRNVLCNKKSSKNSSTTTAATTIKAETTTTTSTNRPKLTAATSRNSFRSSLPSTTTTEYAYEYEDEEEDKDKEEEEIQYGKDNGVIAAEEDPKVIKELILLIKKVGGIEELEKLLEQDSDTMSLKTEKLALTTESTISKSLYDKVLRRPNSLRTFQNKFNSLEFKTNSKKIDTTEEKTDIKSTINKTNNKYSSIVRNSRPTAQNDGLEKLSEFSSFLKEKPKYVTITRTTPSKTNNENFPQEDIDHKITNNDDDDDYDQKYESVATTPSYNTIRRFRPFSIHDTTQTKTAEIIKTEKESSKETEIHRPKKTEYNKEQTTEQTIETNNNKEQTTEQTNVLASPASISIIQRISKPVEEESSSLNYESKDEELSTVTVHILDHKENTTLLPTEHNISTTPRVYSNFARKTTSSHSIKLSAENSTTKQKLQSNSLNPGLTTLTTSFPITIEPISSSIKDIPTIVTTPYYKINPLYNNGEPNTTFIPILKNTTEFYGNTENNFDETETKANTTDEVLLTKFTKYNNSNISVDNSHTNNTNIIYSNNDTLVTNTIKFNKTDIKNTKIDDINKLEDFHNPISTPKTYEFHKRRGRPTTKKSITTPTSAISDPLFSTENEISTKKVSVVSPVNNTSKFNIMNTTVDLNLRSIVVDGTKVKGEIKNRNLESSLKTAQISHRKILFNDSLTKNVETPSIVLNTYSWKDPRIGNFRPWHKKFKSTTNNTNDTNYIDRKPNVNVIKETHNYSSAPHLRKFNNKPYMNQSEEVKLKSQSLRNKNLKEGNEVDKEEKLETKRLKQYASRNETYNLNTKAENLRKNQTQSIKTQNTSKTRIFLNNLNNNSINNTLLNFNKNENENLNMSNITNPNKHYLLENTPINSSEVFTNLTDEYVLSKKNINYNFTDFTRFTQINTTSETEIDNTDNFGKQFQNATIADIERSKSNKPLMNIETINAKNNNYSKIMLSNSTKDIPIKFYNRTDMLITNDTKYPHHQNENEIRHSITESAVNKKISTSKNNSVTNSTINRSRVKTNTRKPNYIASNVEYVHHKDVDDKSSTTESEIPTSSSISNTNKYSLKRRLRVNSTTASARDDLAILDRIQTLNKLPLETTTETTDDFKNTEKYVDNNSFTTEAEILINKSTGNQNKSNRKYSVIKRLRVNTTTESGRDNLTISDRTQTLNKLPLKRITETTDDFKNTDKYVDNNSFTSEAEIPINNSTGNKNKSYRKDSTIKRLTVNTTSESRRYNLKTSDRSQISNKQVSEATTETTNEFKNTEEYMDNKSFTTEAEIPINKSTGNQNKSNRKYSVIKRLRVNTTTESGRDNLTTSDPSQTSNKLLLETTTDTINDFKNTEKYVDNKSLNTESEIPISSSTGNENKSYRKYSVINRFRVNTTTESEYDNLTTSVRSQTSNKLLLETTTETPDNFKNTEEYVDDKGFTTEVETPITSSTRNENKSYRKYSIIKRLRVNTTSESDHDNLTISDRKQTLNRIPLETTTETTDDFKKTEEYVNNKSFTNTLRVNTTTESGRDNLTASDREQTSNKLLLETTTETINDFKYTEEYVDNKSFTTEAEIPINSSTGNENKSYRKYSVINRIRVNTTTESERDNLTISDRTQTLNKIRLETTTETPNDFKKTVEYVDNKSFTTEAEIPINSSTGNKNKSYRKDSTIKRLSVNTTTESKRYNLKTSDRSQTSNKQVSEATTETTNEFKNTEEYVDNKSFTTEADIPFNKSTGNENKSNRKYSVIKRLRVNTTTESKRDNLTISDRTQTIYKLPLETTTETTDVFENTKEYVDNKSFTTEAEIPISSSIRNENKSYRKYSIIKNLRVNTTTSSERDDLEILDRTKTLNKFPLETITETTDDFKNTEKYVDDKGFTPEVEIPINSSTGNNNRSYRKYTIIKKLRVNTTNESERDNLKNSDGAQTLNKIPLETTTETTDDFKKTEEYVDDKIFSTAAEIPITSSTGKENKSYRKYSIINSLRVNTTTESERDNLTTSDRTQTSNKFLLETTTETTDNFKNSDTYIKNKKVNDNSLTIQPVEISSIDKNKTYSRKYSQINRLRLKAITEYKGDDSTIIQDQPQTSFDYKSSKVLSSRTNRVNVTNNSTFSKFHIKSTTEISDNDYTSTNTQNLNDDDNSFTTETVKISSNHTDSSKKYSSINKHPLRTSTDSSRYDLTIPYHTRKSLDHDSSNRKSTLSRLRLHTTTEKTDNIVSTEDYIQHKEGNYNTFSTPKYPTIRRLRLKTTTESVGADLTNIRDKVSNTFDSNSVKVHKTKINKNYLGNDLTLNRHLIQINVETPDDGTEYYNQGKESNVNSFTTESNKINSSNTDRNIYSLKYSPINRHQLTKSSESISDDLTTIEDQTQKTFDSNSAFSTRFIKNYITTDSTLSRHIPNASTETTDIEFTSTPLIFEHEEVYDNSYTTESVEVSSSSISGNKKYSINDTVHSQDGTKEEKLNITSTLNAHPLNAISETIASSDTIQDEENNNIASLFNFKTTTEPTNEVNNEMNYFSTEVSKIYNTRRNKIIPKKDSVLTENHMQTTTKSALPRANDEILKTKTIISKPIYNTDIMRSRNGHVQKSIINNESSENINIKSYSWKDARIGNFRPWQGTTLTPILNEDEEGSLKRKLQNSDFYKINKESPSLPDRSPTNVNNRVNTNSLILTTEYPTRKWYELKTNTESTHNDTIKNYVRQGIKHKNKTMINNNVNQTNTQIISKLELIDQKPRIETHMNDNEAHDNSFTTDPTNKYTHKNSVTKRIQVKTTTEIENDAELNRRLMKTTTDFADDKLTNTEMNDIGFTTESTIIVNDKKTLKYSTEIIHGLKISKEDNSDGLTVIKDETLENVNSKSTEVLKANSANRNYLAINSTLKGRRQQATTEILDSDVTTTETYVNVKGVYNKTFTTDHIKKYAFKNSPTNRLRLETTTRIVGDSKVNTRLINTNIDFADDDLPSTEGNTDSLILTTEYPTRKLYEIKTNTEPTHSDPIIDYDHQDIEHKNKSMINYNVNKTKTLIIPKQELIEKKPFLSQITLLNNNKHSVTTLTNTSKNYNNSRQIYSNLKKDINNEIKNSTQDTLYEENSSQLKSFNQTVLLGNGNSINNSKVNSNDIYNMSSFLTTPIYPLFNRYRKKDSSIIYEDKGKHGSKHIHSQQSNNSTSASIVDVVFKTSDSDSNIKLLNDDPYSHNVTNFRSGRLLYPESQQSILTNTEAKPQEYAIDYINKKNDIREDNTNNTNFKTSATTNLTTSRNKTRTNNYSTKETQIRRTKNNFRDKIVYDKTTEPDAVTITNSDPRIKYLPKYTKRFLLRTTTQSASVATLNERLENTPTVIPDSDLVITKDYIKDNEMNDDRFTTDSIQTLSTTTDNNNIYSVKYSTTRLNGLEATTETNNDGLIIIKDDTLESVNSNSTNILNTTINKNDLTITATDEKLNRRLMKTTTDLPDDGLISTEDYIKENEMNDFTTESTNTDINDIYSLKYSTAIMHGLETSTEAKSDGLTVINDVILENVNSNSTKVHEAETNRNYLEINSTLNSRQQEETTEILDSDVTSTELYTNVKRVYNNSFATDHINKYALKNSPRKRLRLETTTEIASIAELNRRFIETATDFPDDDIPGNEDFIERKEINNNNFTTSTKIGTENIYSRKDTPINKLQLKTSTNIATDDLNNIGDRKQKTFEVPAKVYNSDKSKTDRSLNTRLLKISAGTTEDDLASTEYNIQGKEMNDSNFTSDSIEISQRNTSTTKNIYKLKYSPINRLRLKTIPESEDDNLTINQNHTQQNVDLNSAIVLNTSINEDDLALRTQLQTTTDTSDELENVEDYIQDKKINDYTFTTESVKIINIDKSNNNALKFSPKYKLRLKPTPRFVTHDLTTIQDKPEKTFDSTTPNLLNSRINNNYSKKDTILNIRRFNTKTETPIEDLGNLKDNELYDNQYTTESTSTNTKSNNKYLFKYSPINRLRTKITTESINENTESIINEIHNKEENNKIFKVTNDTGSKDFNEDYSKNMEDNENQTKPFIEIAKERKNKFTPNKFTGLHSLNISNTKISGNEIENQVYFNENHIINNTALSNEGTNQTSSNTYVTSNRTRFNTQNQNSSDSAHLGNNFIVSPKYTILNRRRLKTTSASVSDNLLETDNNDRPSTNSENDVISSRKYSQFNRNVIKTEIQSTINTENIVDNIQQEEIGNFTANSSIISNIDSNTDNSIKYTNPIRNRLITATESTSTENDNHDNNLYNVKSAITSEEVNEEDSNNDILEKLGTDTSNKNNENQMATTTELTNSFENHTMRLYKFYNPSEINDTHFSNITNPHLDLNKIVRVDIGTNNISSDKDNTINIEHVEGFKKNNTGSLIQQINNIRRFQKENNNSTIYKDKEVNITDALNSTISKGRRIRVLKFKRPTFSTSPNNSITNINQTLLTNETSITDIQTPSSGELYTAKTGVTENNYTRKLIRKRPVTAFNIHTDSNAEDNITQTIPPTKHFRKVIKKIIRPRINKKEYDVNNSSTSSSTDSVSSVNLELSSNNTGIIREENVTVSHEALKPNNFNTENLQNNKSLTESLKKKTFRRIYQPKPITAKNLTSTESTTTRTSELKVNKYYSTNPTLDIKKTISTNRNFNIPKVGNRIQNVQTYRKDQSVNAEEHYNVKDDDEEYNDEENDDDENDNDENDNDENDEEIDDDINDEENDTVNGYNAGNADNNERHTKINLDAPFQFNSQTRHNKTKTNYVGKLRDSNQDNLNRFENKKPNFPLSYNKLNLKTQPLLAKISTKRPRVINRPSFTTPFPIQNQIEITKFSSPSTPSVFRSTNTRTYERKYFPSSTENSSQETPQDNPLLEDVNIDALNARNKKIFEITSKKHTTSKPKPLLTEQQPTTEKNTINENDTQHNTTFNLNNRTELNNLNNFQDEVPEHTTVQLSPENLKSSTTNIELTTLKHIFAIDEEYIPTTMRSVYNQSFHSENEGKLVEINRVIEISSQEQTLKWKPLSGLNNSSNTNNTDLKIETQSHVDKLGEISRVKMVEVIQTNSTPLENLERPYLQNDEKIIIANHKTDSDYTPTEFITKSNSILYENNNKKSHTKKDRQLLLPEVIRGIETSTIPLEGLFDSARKSKKLELINGPVVAFSLGEVYTSKSDNNDSILTTTEDPINDISTVQSVENHLTDAVPIEENTTVVEGITVTERNYNYVRPIVPLLRPESNESSPLVISIANLDKVILSKIPKTDSNTAYSAPISQVVVAPKFLTQHISVQNDNNNNSQDRANTIEETKMSFSSQTSILKQKFRQISSRPTLSVRRRLATTTNLPKYSSINLVEERVTTLPLLDETTIVKYNRRISPVYRTNTLRPNNQSKTTVKTTPTYNSNKATHKFVNRRPYVRAENRKSTTINLDPIDTTTVESNTLRNTNNALFRRRYTYTTSTNSPNILTTFPASKINIDQEAGSSIQDSKFTNNKINMIGRNVDIVDNIAESIKEISTVVDVINTTPDYKKQSISLFDIGIHENETNTTTSHKKINRTGNTESSKMPKNINRRPHKIETYEINKNRQFAERTYRPIIDYDYYDDEDVRVVSKSNSLVKVILHNDGIIECLDQGNFAHPISCRKFISCAKMGKEDDGAIGWEYTCPKGLSYDPVGGICNWSSGLGCKE